MSQLATQVRTPRVIALVILILLDGVGWAIAMLPGLNYAMTHGQLQLVRIPVGFAPDLQFGPEIRGLSGPFEALGIGASVVAGLLFVVVSSLKVLAAWWVWNLRKDGAVFELILLALSALFWYGFGLPIPPLFGIALIVLLGLTWKSLG